MAKTITIHELEDESRKIGIEISIYKEELKTETDINSKIKLEYDLMNAEQKLTALKKATDDYREKEGSARDSKHWLVDKELVRDVIDKLNVGYLVEENKIIYCKDFGKTVVNPQVRTFTLGGRKLVRWFENECNSSILRGADEDKILNMFIQEGHTYNDVRSTFDINKWAEGTVYNKMNNIRKFWVQPSEDVNYDEGLDFLFYCVGGGKKENIEHLERWILMKYINPELSSATPNIDLGGGAGGTGKNTFVNLLKTIFTSSCIVSGNIEEFDKFNSAWENAMVLYYDEPGEKELQLAKLKKATGEKDMRLEKKGQDSVQTDRNFSFLFLSNNPKGVVQLSGGSASAEDRRFSVVQTDTTMADEAARRGIKDVDAYIQNVWNNLVENRTEVGKWLGAMILKHEATIGKNLQALHGADYHARFEDQKSEIVKAFDDLMPMIKKNGVVATEWLHELVKDITENDKWKQKTVKDKFEKYLKDAKIGYELKDATKIDVGLEDKARLQAFRLTGEFQKSPYTFDWRSICTVSYDKYAGNKAHYVLSTNHSPETNKVINIAAIMNKHKADMN